MFKKSYGLLGILVHCWVEGSCPVSPHCAGGGCRPGSNPNSDRCCPAERHNRGTGWGPPSWRSLWQPQYPGVLPRWLPRHVDRAGTRSYPWPRPCFAQLGFGAGWTRWVWRKCFWNNLRGSTSDRKLLTLTCRSDTRPGDLRTEGPLEQASGHSAASRRRCFRRWEFDTNFCTSETTLVTTRGRETRTKSRGQCPATAKDRWRPFFGLFWGWNFFLTFRWQKTDFFSFHFPMTDRRRASKGRLFTREMFLRKSESSNPRNTFQTHRKKFPVGKKDLINKNRDFVELFCH